jgi:hypothetical protein
MLRLPLTVMRSRELKIMDMDGAWMYFLTGKKLSSMVVGGMEIILCW